MISVGVVRDFPSQDALGPKDRQLNSPVREAGEPYRLDSPEARRAGTDPIVVKPAGVTVGSLLRQNL